MPDLTEQEFLQDFKAIYKKYHKKECVINKLFSNFHVMEKPSRHGLGFIASMDELILLRNKLKAELENAELENNVLDQLIVPANNNLLFNF